MTRLAGFLLIFLVLIITTANFEIDGLITSFVSFHHSGFVVLIVFSISVLIYSVFNIFSEQIRKKIEDRVEVRNFLGRIRKLSPTDKHVLSLFIEEKKLTCELDPTEPSVAWLESIKMIHRGEGSSNGRKLPFRISLYAMDYLSRNPNLLR